MTTERNPVTSPPKSAPATLVAWLDRQAERRGAQVALRHKHAGVWHERRWQPLRDEVRSLAGGLERHGFGPGQPLVLLSQPRPEALLLALAAQWLGGAALLLDPNDSAAAQERLLAELQPAFVFAEGEAQLDRVAAAGLAPQLLLHADARGAQGHASSALRAGPGIPAALAGYAQLLGEGRASTPTPRVQAQQPAFLIARLDEQQRAQVQVLRHAELLAQGEALVDQERLSEREEALAARAFAAAGQARYLVAPWLIAGFRLNFPENLATRDNDRREIGPTLVAGTRETWQRVEAWVRELLPPPGTRQRRLVDWALAPRPGALRAALGHVLVRRPLRDVMGLTRTRVPLLVGEPLPPPSAQFFAALGVPVRAWPDAAPWQPVAPAAAAPQHGRGVEMAHAGAAFAPAQTWRPA